MLMPASSPLTHTAPYEASCDRGSVGSWKPGRTQQTAIRRAQTATAGVGFARWMQPSSGVASACQPLPLYCGASPRLHRTGPPTTSIRPMSCTFAGSTPSAERSSLSLGSGTASLRVTVHMPRHLARSLIPWHRCCVVTGDGLAYPGLSNWCHCRDSVSGQCTGGQWASGHSACSRQWTHPCNDSSGPTG